MRPTDADGLPALPRGPIRRALLAALAGVALGGAWAGYAGWRSMREAARHPWIADCLGQPLATGNASFFLPPIHTADRRYCLSAPALESLAKDAPEEGRAFADRRDLTRIEVWDAREKRYWLLAGHTGRVRCWALAAPLLLTASDDARDPAVRLWSLDTGRLLRTFGAGRPACWGGFGLMGFSTGGGRVVTATEDRTVHVWDAATGAALGTLAPGEPATVFAFSPDGATLALGGFSGAIALWDWRAGRELRHWAAHDRFGATQPGAGGVEHLAFSADGARLVSTGPADAETVTREWLAATGEPAPR